MTTKYVTYDPTTGEIKTWGAADYAPILLDGTAVLWNANGAPSTHYVSNQALVAYTGPQVTAKASVPPYPRLGAILPLAG